MLGVVYTVPATVQGAAQAFATDKESIKVAVVAALPPGVDVAAVSGPCTRHLYADSLYECNVVRITVQCHQPQLHASYQSCTCCMRRADLLTIWQ